MENEKIEDYPEELVEIADSLGGEVHLDDEDGYYIRIDTGDEDAGENYDDLVISCQDIEDQLDEYEISEKWADHDTQIIEFEKV